MEREEKLVRENGEIRCRSMMGLSDGEQLVIWGIRRVVALQGVDPDLLAEFQAAFGAEANAGLRLFCGFFRRLSQAARRPYEIAPLSTLRVTRDEQRILALLGAAQLGAASGDHALFEAHLLWLAASDHRPALARVSLGFAELLARHGHGIAVAPSPVVVEAGGAARPAAAAPLQPRSAFCG